MLLSLGIVCHKIKRQVGQQLSKEKCKNIFKTKIPDLNDLS